MDFLSKPFNLKDNSVIKNIIQMLTPLAKTPIGMISNKSFFWKDTLNEYEMIEETPGETTNYLGFEMPKSSAYLLRNIRLLNELDKLNAFNMFGGEKGEKSWAAKANIPGFTMRGLGLMTPSASKYSGNSPVPSTSERVVGSVLGKYQAYKPSYSRSIYNFETTDKIREIKALMTKAAKKGDYARVKILREQLKEFVKERKQ
jgi:hypothetical protein